MKFAYYFELELYKIFLKSHVEYIIKLTNPIMSYKFTQEKEGTEGHYFDPTS